MVDTSVILAYVNESDAGRHANVNISSHRERRAGLAEERRRVE